METPADKHTDDEVETPQRERRSGPPDDEGEPSSGPSLPALLGRTLLALLLGSAAMLLASVLEVYVTGLAARRLGLPELPVTLTFLGLLAIVVVALVGANIAARIEGAGRQLTRAVEDVGERVVDEVSTSTEELGERLEQIPMVLVAEPPNGTFPGGKGQRPGRR
jgi:membrane protein implicated in regulation of membrane protease activity